MWTLIIYLNDETSISEDFEVMSQAEIRVNKIMQSGFKGKQGDKTIYYPLHIIKKMEIIPKS
jgi:hypothetical protein